MAQRSRRAPRRRRCPRVIVEHPEQTGQRRADLRELVGNFLGPAPGPLVDLALGGFLTAEPVESAGDHVGELADDVLGDIARRPTVAPARAIPVSRVDRPDERLEAAGLGLELGLGHGAGQAHEALRCLRRDSDDKVRTKIVDTRVRFRHLTRSEIESYIASREWRGKAGGYAIQGLAGCFVQQIVGSYTNIVGLPVAEVVGLLTSEGFPIHFNWLKFAEVDRD